MTGKVDWIGDSLVSLLSQNVCLVFTNGRKRLRGWGDRTR